MEKAAQRVLDARAAFPGSTLADLYDPLAMPPALSAAHADLDKAVDKCYRAAAFPSDRARVEFLFARYEQLTAPLAPAAKTRKKARTKPLIEGVDSAESYAKAAHFHGFQEPPTPYGAKEPSDG